MSRFYFILLFLILATIAVFWPVYSFDFVIWDDNINVYENSHLNPPTISSILHFWKEPFALLYIPLTYTTWAIIAKMSLLASSGGSSARLNPLFFHTANLMLHILNVLLVFVILRLLLKYKSTSINQKPETRNLHSNDLSAGFGAMLFALHPVQVESVAWVTGMKDVLFSFFSLISIWQYLIYSHNNSGLRAVNHGVKNLYFRIRNSQLAILNRNFLFAFFAFVLAMLAKPTAVVVPILLLAIDYFIIKKQIKESIYSLFYWIVLSVLFVIITKFSQAGVILGFSPPLWFRPLIAGDAVTYYLYKLLMPIYFSTDYGRSPEFIFQHNWVYITGLFPYVLAGLVLFKKNYRIPAISGTIFLIGLLPVLGIVPFGFQYNSTVADRYLYLSMLGPALGLAWFFSQNRHVFITFSCVLILGFLGIRSSFQIWNWQNTFTLFDNTIKVNPESYVSYNNLGVAFAKKGKYNKAIDNYMEALRIKPKKVDAYISLGAAFMGQKRFSDAIYYFSKALQIKPANAKVHNNLGVVFTKQKLFSKAHDHFNISLKINPNNEATYDHIGTTFAKMGEPAKAINNFKKALKINPNYAPAHNNLGTTYAEKGETNKAINHFSFALQSDPDNVSALNNLGIIFRQQGNLSKAIKKFREALSIMPDYFDAHYNMGLALAQEGNYAGAIMHYARSLQSEPDDPEVHNNLGVALGKQGKAKEAIAHFAQAQRIKPDFTDAYNNMGIALHGMGKTEEAIVHFSNALQIDPDFAKVHFNLGFILSNQGRKKDAIFHYNKVLQNKPDYPKVRYYLGMALEDLGKINEALIQYREELRLKPDWVPALNKVTWILATHENPEFRDAKEAVKLAEQANQSSGDSQPETLDVLAAAYAEAGRFNDAIQIAKRAAKLAGNNKQKELAGDIKQRLSLYETGRPFRQSQEESKLSNM